MKRTTLLLCLSLVATTVAQGAANDILSLNRASLISPEIVKAHVSEFGFTAEQQATLRGKADELKPQLKALEATVRDEQETLETLVKNIDAKPEAAASQLEKLLAAESVLKHFQLKALLELRLLLTPEQRALALHLAQKDSQAREPVEMRVKHKAEALKSAWDQIGIEPPAVLRSKGQDIEALAHDGKLEEADKALDALAEEVGLDVPVSDEAIDFAKFEPGSTDLDTLKERYESVGNRAKEITRLPTLRLLLKGRDELEKAKAAEDAERVARILSWAEDILAKEQ